MTKVAICAACGCSTRFCCTECGCCEDCCECGEEENDDADDVGEA